MNWFKRHLHWTALFIWLGASLAALLGGCVVVLFDPYVSEEALYGLGVVVGILVLGGGWGWVLKQKARSLWWLPLAILVPLGWVVVFALENKNEIKAED